MTTAREETSRLADLLRREHHALAEFLVALAEFDRRQLWMQLGYRSLFDHLCRELGLSKAAAFYRLTAARLIQKHPQVVEPLRDGRLCFSSVVELSKVLTAENGAEVLPRFFHLSKKEAQEVRAELAPAPVVPRRAVVTAVTRAPPVAPTGSFLPPGEVTPARSLGLDSCQPVHPGEPPPASCPASKPSRALVVEPKTGELSRLHLTVPRRLLQKLAAARDALSHSHPGASEETILEVGLDLVIERHRRRRGIGAKPRTARAAQPVAAAGEGSVAAPASPAPVASAPPPTGRSRHVPAAVWRGVWERDRGSCAWPLAKGGVCGSTNQIELDHVDGWALGAGTTVEETRLLCRFHQDVSARRLYGDELMNTYTKPKGETCSEPVARYGRPPARARSRRSVTAASSSTPPPGTPERARLEPARRPGYSSAA